MTSDVAPTAAVPADQALTPYCPDCGYDLRAIDSERCPECGSSVDRTSLGRATIPWSQRRRLGRTRAYWRTVRLVMFEPARFAREIGRPVSLADARAFRRVTVWIAFMPVAIGIVAAYLATFAPPLGWTPLMRLIDPWLPAWLEPLLIVRPATLRLSPGLVMELFVLAALLAAVWLWLYAAAGVASYWFHPSHLDVPLQNRAVALSYYACAPLVITPTAAMLAAIAVVLRAAQSFAAVNGTAGSFGPWPAGFHFGAYLAAAVQLIAWWGVSVAALRLVTRAGLERVAAFAVALPILWTMLGVWIVGGIVGTAVLLAVVVVTVI